MKTFIKIIIFWIIPAFAAFTFFAEAQSAFVSAHNLFNVWCFFGWLFSAWEIFILCNAYFKWVSYFNEA